MADYYQNATSGEVVSFSFKPSGSDWERLSKAKGKALLAEQTKAELRTILKPGDEVLCFLRSVSSSEMSRVISFYVVQGNTLRDITLPISWALDYPEHPKGGLKVTGCGMDMGWHVVYQLGRALWPEGTPEPHGERNGAPDRSGGYALKSRWM